MENQIELVAKMIVERPLSNIPSNTVTLWGVEEQVMTFPMFMDDKDETAQELEESTSLRSQEPLLITTVVEEKFLLLVMSILQENEDYQQDSSKKTTQTSLGTSSSQPVEDDDEADESYNPSNDEEHEADAQNKVSMDSFQTEMRTAFKQL
ncbi:hypothetical protein M9H77_02037 [Catharanthus roseus]|uniref:Uncharacterized protein n=1 Tax=Catharanthus roseus TaxID=4058 RepID=A0ACC0C787_CATRO|nr:hypothetical protein M9H77_02037 [Catharanthus roseus]